MLGLPVWPLRTVSHVGAIRHWSAGQLDRDGHVKQGSSPFCSSKSLCQAPAYNLTPFLNQAPIR